MSTDVGIAVGELRESVADLKKLETRFEKLELAFHERVPQPMTSRQKVFLGVVITVVLGWVGWTTDWVLRDRELMSTLEPISQMARDHQERLVKIESTRFKTEDGMKLWSSVAELSQTDAVLSERLAALQDLSIRIERKLDKIESILLKK